MKKAIIVFVAAVFMIFCFAEGEVKETYKTAGDLYQAWAESYPDYICGVWSTDGSMTNLTFSVINNESGELGKQEILDLVEDDSTVSFAYGNIARNYLANIQEELLPYFEKDLGLVFSALNETDNCINLGILEERKDDTKTLAMLAELKDKYGDIFIIEYTDEISDLTLTLPSVEGVPDVSFESDVLVNNGAKPHGYLYFVIGGVSVLAIALLTMLMYRKKSAAKVTNTGSVIAADDVSLSDVKALVRESKLSPSEKFDERVFKDLNK